MDVLNPAKKLHFPHSVVEMMQGAIGFPEGGWPKVLQKIILDTAGAKPIKGRPGAKLPKADFEKTREAPGRQNRPATCATWTCCRICSIRRSSSTSRNTCAHYDNTSVLPTHAFFYGMQSGEEISVEIEPGKTLIVKYLTTGEVREDGTRTVFFELNGQPREVVVTDRSREATMPRHPKADPDNPNHVAAPMPGKISSVAVDQGPERQGRQPACFRSRR